MKSVELTCHCCNQDFPIEQNTSLDSMAAILQGIGVCYGCSPDGDPRVEPPTKEAIEAQYKENSGFDSSKIDAVITVLRTRDLLNPAHMMAFERMNYRNQAALVMTLVERGVL